jgi:phage terminase small subunit
VLNSKKETNKKADKNKPKRNLKTESAATGLTPAQEKFVDGLFMGLSQREAYQGAYSTEGWKTSLIDSKASALAKVDKIRVRLEAMQEAYRIRLENRLSVNKDWVMQKLFEIANSNVLDLLEIEEKEVFVGVDKKTFKPKIERYGTIRMFPSKDVARTKYNAVSGIKAGKYGVEFKFYDKPKAIELLGRELGMFKEKVENENINMTYEEYIQKCAEDARKEAEAEAEHND